MGFVDDDRRRSQGRQRWHQPDQARIEPLAGHVAPVRIIPPPRAGGILGPLGRHKAGEHGAFAARLRQARHRRQHAFEPGDMPVGPFGEECLHVDAQMNGVRAERSEPETGSHRMSSRGASGGLAQTA